MKWVSGAMSCPKKGETVTNSVAHAERARNAPWITQIADVLRYTDRTVDPRLRTTLSANVKRDRASLFLPPEMSVRQPESLRYIQAFASHNNCRLVEDRRSVDVQPIIEQRHRKLSPMAMGVSTLLKQTGLPGSIRSLSIPHRLDTDSPHIKMTQLIEMAAKVVDKSKRVVLLPNQFIVQALGNDTHPIIGHACNLVSGEVTTVLSYFESPAFRSVGYMAKKQFVIHVLLAGGPLQSPETWTNLHALGDSVFRFQLFRSNHPGRDFGLFYRTFYIDLDSTEKHSDDLTIDKADTHIAPTR